MLPPTKNAALRRSSALALLEAGAQVEGALEAQKILKSASARQKIPDNFAPREVLIQQSIGGGSVGNESKANIPSLCNAQQSGVNITFYVHVMH